MIKKRFPTRRNNGGNRRHQDEERPPFYRAVPRVHFINFFPVFLVPRADFFLMFTELIKVSVQASNKFIEDLVGLAVVIALAHAALFFRNNLSYKTVAITIGDHKTHQKATKMS